jgi:hypothetical protein
MDDKEHEQVVSLFQEVDARCKKDGLDGDQRKRALHDFIQIYNGLMQLNGNEVERKEIAEVQYEEDFLEIVEIDARIFLHFMVYGDKQEV